MQFGSYFSKKKKFGDIHRDTHTHTHTQIRITGEGRDSGEKGFQKLL